LESVRLCTDAHYGAVSVAENSFLRLGTYFIEEDRRSVFNVTFCRFTRTTGPRRLVLT